MSETVVRPRPSGRHREVDLEEEYLFYDGSGEAVHVLNGTARDIYRLCDGSRTLGDIALVLATRYDVPPETALGDASRTITELAGLGLVLVD